MKTLITILLLAATRPPGLTPEQIPFPYDANMVTSGIIDYVGTEPNVSFIYEFNVHNRRGWDVELVVTTPDPNRLLITKVSRTRDPEGGWNHQYRILWTPPAGVEAIYYIELSAKSWLSRTDRRTLLVYAGFPDDPFIFRATPAVAHWPGEYQQFVQRAAKQGVWTSKPVHVRL